jgi:hypothetical protein
VYLLYLRRQNGDGRRGAARAAGAPAMADAPARSIRRARLRRARPRARRRVPRRDPPTRLTPCGAKYGFVVRAEKVDGLGDKAWRLWTHSNGREVTYHWRRDNLGIEVHVHCYDDAPTSMPRLERGQMPSMTRHAPQEASSARRPQARALRRAAARLARARRREQSPSHEGYPKGGLRPNVMERAEYLRRGPRSWDRPPRSGDMGVHRR